MNSSVITRRDWWIGIAIVAGAILIHAAWPRYDWRHVTGTVFVRIDRWTGHASLHRVVAERAIDVAPTVASPRPSGNPEQQGPLRIEKVEPVPQH